MPLMGLEGVFQGLLEGEYLLFESKELLGLLEGVAVELGSQSLYLDVLFVNEFVVEIDLLLLRLQNSQGRLELLGFDHEVFFETGHV